MPPREISKEDVPCDSCTGNTLMSVKSCFVCQLSYCNEHLKPHLTDPVLTKHSLTDPATFATSNLCRTHNKPLNKFCKRDQTPICIRCRELEHKHHETVSIEKESKKLRVRKTIHYLYCTVFGQSRCIWRAESFLFDCILIVALRCF